MGIVASQSADGSTTIAHAPFKEISIAAPERDILSVDEAITGAKFYIDLQQARNVESSIVQSSLAEFQKFSDKVRQMLRLEWEKHLGPHPSSCCYSRDILCRILCDSIDEINNFAMSTIESTLHNVCEAECDIFVNPSNSHSSARARQATMRNKVQLTASLNLERSLTVLRKALLNYLDVVKHDFPSLATAMIRPIFPDFSVESVEQGAEVTHGVTIAKQSHLDDGRGVDTAVSFDTFNNHITDIITELMDLPKLVDEIALVQRTDSFRFPYTTDGVRTDLSLSRNSGSASQSGREPSTDGVSVTEAQRQQGVDSRLSGATSLTTMTRNGGPPDSAQRTAVGDAESLRVRLHAVQLKQRLEQQRDALGDPLERQAAERRAEEQASTRPLVVETPSQYAELLDARASQLEELIAQIHKVSCTPPTFATFTSQSGSHVLQLDAGGGSHRFRMTQRDRSDDHDGSAPVCVFSGSYCQLSPAVIVLLVKDRVTGNGLKEHFVDTIQLVREEVGHEEVPAPVPGVGAKPGEKVAAPQPPALYGWHDVKNDVLYSTMVPVGLAPN